MWVPIFFSCFVIFSGGFDRCLILCKTHSWCSISCVGSIRGKNCWLFIFQVLVMVAHIINSLDGGVGYIYLFTRSFKSPIHQSVFACFYHNHDFYAAPLIKKIRNTQNFLNYFTLYSRSCIVGSLWIHLTSCLSASVHRAANPKAGPE